MKRPVSCQIVPTAIYVLVSVGTRIHEMELVAGIRMVSVLIDDDHHHIHDHVLTDDANFSLILSLFSLCR